MSYTLPQISEILLKADKTVYRLGAIAYDDMFAEDSEALDYERDIIFIYKKCVEWADDFYVGNTRLDSVVERLSAKVNIYDYGKLTPIYSDSVTQNAISTVSPYVLKTTNLSLGQGLFGSNNFTQETVSISVDYDYVKSQVRENYVHDQQVASSSWVVPHQLNKYASVSIVNTANQAIVGDITYNSLNQLTITFTSPISGKAYIN
jgi:hypothetical protein